MTFGAPPSKAAQEAEAAARNAALEAAGTGPDMNEGNVEIIGEDTSPAQDTAPAAVEPKAEAPAEEKKEPTAPPNPRDEIARRYRERREKERETFIGHEVEPKPLFLNGEKPAAEEAAPAEQAPEEKTYELKVFGKSENVTREQLLAMADLTAEDAADLPEKTLIK